ncbi:FAD-binding domain-containing protein [Rhizodiscina lignyota]|uniref:D-lactate dehydrogenase (cytochrome) n=1 Tax=Rhizodiscina lignyota TaxID=1504668 RepID=A0A9P4I624_9PEZI|nr:FAD-binding domain-containing protein [Rhizodiscina lignyota]
MNHIRRVAVPRQAPSSPIRAFPIPAQAEARVAQSSAFVVRRYASNDSKDEEKGSFKSQLYESSAARLQREREEQARFANVKRNRFEGDEGETRSNPLLANSVWAIVLAISSYAAYRFGYSADHPPNPNSTIPLESTVAPQLDASETTLQAAWADMRAIVGDENVSTNMDDRATHAHSEWSSYLANQSEIAFMVVRPGSTEDVSNILKVCHRRKIPVTAYSGGTSLEGHFAPTRGGITLEFSRMNEIVRLDQEDMDVIVQPGLGWEDLNETLAQHNLFFPPDPGPGAQIGGMVGTGCSGTNAYRYGTMREWVLALTVVLADGTVIKTRQRPRKSSAGYDLTKIFIGAEGTLGIVTEATLKVTSRPMNTSVAVCTFPTVKDAADCVFKVVGAGVPIAAVELLDDAQMKCINDIGSTTRKWTEAPTLLFKFAGTPTSVKEHISIVQSLAKQTKSKTFEFAKNGEQSDELWSARKEALWSTMAKAKPGDKVWTTDVAVPISRLPDCIEETRKDLKESGLFATILGHVGDGNFHTILLYNENTERDIAEDVVHRMVKRAIEMEGTATGEHGVGLVKRDYLPHELGETTVDAMRKLKLAFDPLCLLNCDKIVRVQKPKPGELQEW